MNAMRNLTRARTQLLLDAPFFGSLALRLKVLEDGSTETAYTDGVVLGVNPAFIESLSGKATQGLLAHEVMHLACLHHTRRDGREPRRWNVACDYAVNHLLVEAGFQLPEGLLHDDRYAGLSAEAIYDRLPEDTGGSGEGPSGPGRPGEVRDAPGADSRAMRQAEAQWRVSISQAAQQARAAGNLPEAIQRLVEETINPVVDWRAYLRLFIERTARNNYAWLPPNRRYLAYGLCLPGLHSRELDRVVVAVDTSGSIDDRTLSGFVAEVSSILEEYDTEIEVVYCDNQVRGSLRVSRQDLPLRLEPSGGGGTDFRPVFAWVAQEGLTPSCLVYLTDLECRRFPEPAPDYPVLWVQWGEAEYAPPFGEVVRINP